MRTIEHRLRQNIVVVRTVFLILLALMLAGCTNLLDYEFGRRGGYYKKHDPRESGFYTVPPKN